MNNLPPFYVGQRVVAIENHSNLTFKKGQEFTVTGIFPAYCNCGGFNVTIGILCHHEIDFCPACRIRKIATTKEWLFWSGRFAPLQERGFPLIQLTKVIEKEQQLVSAN